MLKSKNMCILVNIYQRTRVDNFLYTGAMTKIDFTYYSTISILTTLHMN